MHALLSASLIAVAAATCPTWPFSSPAPQEAWSSQTGEAQSLSAIWTRSHLLVPRDLSPSTVCAVQVVGVAYAARLENGSVVSGILEPPASDLGLGTVAAFHASWTGASKFLQSGTVGLVAGLNSFVAIKDNGQVVTWGSQSSNDRFEASSATDTRYVWDLLYSGVVDVRSNNVGKFEQNGFAALRSDGRFVSWGSSINSTQVQDELQNGVNSIGVSPSGYVYAMKSNGQLVIVASGSQVSAPFSQLTSGVAKVVELSINSGAVIKQDGTAVVWGYLSSPPPLTDVVDIIPRQGAARTSTGQVIAWGPIQQEASRYGPELASGVRQIAPFAPEQSTCVVVVTSTGRVIFLYDNQPTVVQLLAGKYDTFLRSGIVRVESTNEKFAAFKADGRALILFPGSYIGNPVIVPARVNQVVGSGGVAALTDKGEVFTQTMSLSGGSWLRMWQNTVAMGPIGEWCFWAALRDKGMAIFGDSTPARQMCSDDSVQPDIRTKVIAVASTRYLGVAIGDPPLPSNEPEPEQSPVASPGNVGTADDDEGGKADPSPSPGSPGGNPSSDGAGNGLNQASVIALSVSITALAMVGAGFAMNYAGCFRGGIGSRVILSASRRGGVPLGGDGGSMQINPILGTATAGDQTGGASGAAARGAPSAAAARVGAATDIELLEVSTDGDGGREGDHTRQRGTNVAHLAIHEA